MTSGSYVVIDDEGELEVWCCDAPDAVFTVTICTLTIENLEHLLEIPRRGPKRVH